MLRDLSDLLDKKYGNRDQNLKTQTMTKTAGYFSMHYCTICVSLAKTHFVQH